MAICACTYWKALGPSNFPALTAGVGAGVGTGIGDRLGVGATGAVGAGVGSSERTPGATANPSHTS